jgi:hypothetical protein
MSVLGKAARPSNFIYQMLKNNDILINIIDYITIYVNKLKALI